MIGIYFSGTGNSRYALEIFIKKYGNGAVLYSIEDEKAVEELDNHDEVVISYPVQYSTVPKFLWDFIDKNSKKWSGKKVFIIATMGLFSGDGTGVLGRLLKQHGAIITGGLHLKMPDSIADEKVLKRPLEKNIMLVNVANQKIKKAVFEIKRGKYPQEGLGILYRIAGFFGQRLWFGYKTKNYSNRLKIDVEKCVGCAKCINICPKRAITLLGKKVVCQTSIEKYLK